MNFYPSNLLYIFLTPAVIFYSPQLLTILHFPDWPVPSSWNYAKLEAESKRRRGTISHWKSKVVREKKMQGLKPLIRRRFNVRDSITAFIHTTEPENPHYRLTPKRSFIDLYQVPLSSIFLLMGTSNYG